MARTNQRGRKSNNPEGHNQYDRSWTGTAKDRPMATVAATAAVVGAGVFLWSRRNQISEQISNLSDQVTGWAGNSQGGNGAEFETAEGGNPSASTASTQQSSGDYRASGGQSGQTTGSTAGTGQSNF